MRMDASKLHSFSGKLEYGDVYQALYLGYHLGNLRTDDEFVEPEVCMAVRDDYNFGMANFEAYIQPGMDARLFFELRKSALLPFGDGEFYSLHGVCRTVSDVRDLRIRYMKRYLAGYEDWDWQYNILIRYIWGSERTKNWSFNFEWVFGDRDMAKQTYMEDYPQDFARYLMGDLVKLL